jgi:hypothetical protein
MLRLETETGWWLITHPDHARLAGAFAEAWGNNHFVSPEPRETVLLGIRAHDDGWTARDAEPQITRQRKPSAFSTELVGQYSAFEEIDLRDYLGVRDRAVRLIAEENAYAGLLVSLHTYNLLSKRTDRSTIKAEERPLLDEFLTAQGEYQKILLKRIRADEQFSDAEKSEERIQDHFRLLQATDNLSLLSCVGYMQPATLLHPLPVNGMKRETVRVTAVAERHFRLEPYPLRATPLTFTFPARKIEEKLFTSAKELQQKFAAAPVEMLMVTVSA